MNSKKCSVIIVTYNSGPVLNKCIEALKTQTLLPQQIILVDSGSQSTDYLKKYETDPRIQIELVRDNIGFCVGNNRGWKLVSSGIEFVLLLNPDAFLTPSFLEQAVCFMESHPRCGALSPLLLGYDISQGQPTGKIDSSGVFRNWYGRWYDRDQGEAIDKISKRKNESVPALCGALMFCRKTALDEVAFKSKEILDPSFYMYKEDIDLSLRLRDNGWSLELIPELIAYHCRGWKKDRSKVPFRFRLMSARNEWSLHSRRFSPFMLYSGLKYLAVRLFNL